MILDSEKLLDFAKKYRISVKMQEIMADNAYMTIGFDCDKESEKLFLDDIQGDSAQSELISKFIAAMDEYQKALNRRIKGIVTN